MLAVQRGEFFLIKESHRGKNTHFIHYTHILLTRGFRTEQISQPFYSAPVST